MRRNRRNNAKKERIIMIASSAFVLTALTMTGIYMRSNNAESQDDGYTLDLTELEDSAEDKFEEIAQNNQIENIIGTEEYRFPGDDMPEMENLEDDLDFMPLEVGSGLVEIPGLTDGLQQETPIVEDVESPAKVAVATPKPEPKEEPDTSTSNVVVTKTLHFAESDGLLRPLSGEVLIPFSMDGSVYFSTLDQFKYNPALMIVAEEGTSVVACAEGKVIEIFENEEIGHAITMEIGDGYQITYGQLKDINVTLDSYVNPGEIIASVAAPTKYFSVEGSNLYLKLTADGTPVNPEPLFR